MTAVPHRHALAAITVATGIRRAIFLQWTARQADTRLAGSGSGRLQLLEEDRLGEIIALRVTDPGGGLQIGEFLEGFDALGDDGHAERFAQGLDRPQDALAAGALVNVGDERAVDLDLVGGD